ncbi:C39 family peptidase [Phreatobacter stygius]|uniref:Peptidase C39-like domain-containing protein n=1 Tax=Phreatobacter stygius TaxID=1940610 RepID=A0A4D7AWX0_9HYPH|nr:C39 family peptidase [Phreatobacter stygius]QCI63443.1 hypothetical protein E8M01_03830 [Phreatobacter stygius]
MANFKIPENGRDISSFDLPLDRTIRLLQWGGDPQGNRLDVALDRSVAGVTLTALSAKQPAASTLFEVKGTAIGTTFGVAAYLPGTTQRYSKDLKMRVCGEPVNQLGYTVDLIAQLAANGSAKQVYLYSRILSDPSDSTHILSQNTTAGQYNCGDVAAGYGTKIFTKPTHTAYFTYYLPPQSDKMADLRFNANRLKLGIAKIKTMLDKGTPVRVWLIHHDGFKPIIQGDTRTHFLTIVGYSATKFLCLDPWPGGSELDYQGGMYAKTRNAFMGELEFDPVRLELGIGSPAGSLGAHSYKVIAGP